jgi:hypothetical protein
MKKWGWSMYAVVLVCFLLPFFSIKCDGFTVAEVSGMCMVIGCEPESEMDGMGMDDDEEQEMEPIDKQPWAIAALALAVIGLCLTFVRTKFAWMGSAIVSLLGLAALIALYVKATGDLPDVAGGETGGGGGGEDDFGGMMDKEVKITIEGGIGYYGACAMFLFTAVASFLTMKDRTPPGGASGPAGPPGFSPPPPGAPPGPPVGGAYGGGGPQAPPAGGFGGPPQGGPPA